MRRLIGAFGVFGVILFTFAACAGFSPTLTPRSEGEVRLTRMQLPEVMQTDVSYDVIVDYEADGEPAIEKLCLRWVTENTSISSPSLYCYASEVQSNQSIGAVCPRWIGDGPYTDVSPTFYLNRQDISYEGSGRFTAKIPASVVKSGFNKLICYGEYRKGGELAETNRVSARTTIER